MKNLRDAHRMLHRDFAELSALWNDVRGQWRDETSIQFEKEHWRLAEQALNDYLRALDRLTEVIERAEQAANES